MSAARFSRGVRLVVAEAALGALTNYPGNGWNTVASVAAPQAGRALIDALAMWRVASGHPSSCRVTVNGVQVGPEFHNQFAYSGPLTGGVHTSAVVAPGDVVALQVKQVHAASSVNVHQGAHVRVSALG